MQGVIESIFIYPVKSCAGIEVEQADLNTYGLLDDRKWMIVDSNGTMLTQRKEPLMVQIQAKLHEGILSLSHKQNGTIKVGEPTSITAVSIWADTCDALCASNDVNLWLSDTLKSKTPLRLVKFNQGASRTPGQPERFGNTAKHFTDAAPLLVCNAASLTMLNTHLKKHDIETVTMAHFRPNIVISGIPAFKEHKTKGITVNEGDTIEMVDHCQRCAIVTVNPSTGIRRNKATPLQQIAEVNSMPNNIKAPAFGVNACFKPATGHTSSTLHKHSPIRFL